MSAGYPPDRRLDGPQSRTVRFGDNFLNIRDIQNFTISTQIILRKSRRRNGNLVLVTENILALVPRSCYWRFSQQMLVPLHSTTGTDLLLLFLLLLFNIDIITYTIVIIFITFLFSLYEIHCSHFLVPFRGSQIERQFETDFADLSLFRQNSV
jgi:hypothetical protein